MKIKKDIKLFLNVKKKRSNGANYFLHDLKNKSIDLDIFNGKKTPEKTWDDITHF